ncbi:MAG: hypothetical protein G01um101425_730 [Candidatus Peregrinibacteria bacterium Gr01-1014_25]|nr:MAG: hypothetical protein G01um101425_730 [Candidatus Peregrinibacteria bacterium Gr01-1014_25]
MLDEARRLQIDELRLNRAEELLEITFKSRALLRRALTHPSAVMDLADSFTQFSLIGDAVVVQTVAHHVRDLRADATSALHFVKDHQIISIEENTASRENLSKVASDRSMGSLLFLPPELEKARSELHIDLLRKALCGVIGGLQEDQGPEVASAKAWSWLLMDFNKRIAYYAAGRASVRRIAVSKCVELARKKYGASTFECREALAPGEKGSRHFVISVYYAGRLLGVGKASSKQEAKQRAAINAWANKSTWPD